MDILETIQAEFKEAGLRCAIICRFDGISTGLLISSIDKRENKFSTITIINDILTVNIFNHPDTIGINCGINCDQRKITLHDQSQFEQFMIEMKRRYGNE